MTDLDQLDIMRRAITALGLGQCAPEELVAEARASSSRREQDRGTLADQRARINDLESALRDLGVNVGGDLQGEVRAITNRTAANEAAAQHDLDCALREREAANAKIASNIAEATARVMQIAELKRDLAAKDASLKTAHAALKEICEVIGVPIPVCPDEAVVAVKHVHNSANFAESRAKVAEATLAEMVSALADAGAPKVYDLPDDGERPIPDPERIRLLGERVRSEHAERIREGDRAQIYRDRLAAADLALDDRDAPRHADGSPLSVAARIRALPR